MFELLVCIAASLGAGMTAGLAGISTATVISPLLIALLGFDAYEAMGGNGNVTLDVPLPFAKLIMQLITGYPLEALGKLSARDGIRLRARIYRFFYLSK